VTLRRHRPAARVAAARGCALRRAPAVAAVLASIAMAGCASVAPVVSSPGAQSFSGRLSVHVDANGSEGARAFNAAFELEGDPTRGRLDLTTPLGSIVARARWSPGSVTLVAPPRAETTYPDLDALTREVVGESLPVAALFDWLRAQPWPGAPSEPAPDGHGFDQLGWSVDLARFEADALVSARRARPPAVDVRIKLDR
jgi:outer membrane lipoprotein LolB